MLAAGKTPNRADYTDLLGEVIKDDLAPVDGFVTSIVHGLGFSFRRSSAALSPARSIRTEEFVANRS